MAWIECNNVEPEIIDITPDDTNPATLTSGTVYKANGNGKAVASINSITPDNVSPVRLLKNTNYNMRSNGYAISTAPVDKTPSDSAPPFVSNGNIIRTCGNGYLYEHEQLPKYLAFNQAIYRRNQGCWGNESDRNYFTTYESNKTLLRFLNDKEVVLQISAKNVTLESVTTSNSISSITIITLAAAGDKVVIKDVHYLNRSSCIIEYLITSSGNYWGTLYCRVITMKCDGSLVQSSQITLSAASTATQSCSGMVIPMLDSKESFLLLRTTTNDNTQAKSIQASRLYITFTSGAAAIPSSSAWITISAANTNTYIDLNTAYCGIVYYTNASSDVSLFVWHGYSNGYINKTLASLVGDANSRHGYCYGYLTNGCLLFSSSSGLTSSTYWSIVTLDTITGGIFQLKQYKFPYNSSISYGSVLGLSNDILYTSNGYRWKITLNGIQELPKMTVVSSYLVAPLLSYIGTGSDPFRGIYVFDELPEGEEMPEEDDGGEDELLHLGKSNIYGVTRKLNNNDNNGNIIATDSLIKEEKEEKNDRKKSRWFAGKNILRSLFKRTN